MNLDWKQLFKLGRNQVLGLDIGSSAVKVIQMSRDNGSFTVNAAAVANVADDTDNNEESSQINTVQAIRDCIITAGIQTRFAVCSVCGPEVAIRYFKFPALPTEEIPGAVMLEAAQVCPFNVENGGVDYQLIPDEQDNVVGVLVATTNKMMEGKRKLAEDASLDSVLMDVDGLALLNCFSGYEKQQSGRATAILNVGSSFATLAIIGDDDLPFVRDTANAADDIIKQIAAENEVTISTVKNILLNTSNTTEPQLGLSGSLKRASQKLIADVADTLRYYAAQERATPVEKIFVCGGFALVEDFVELLDDHLPVAAVLWNPFDNAPCDADQQCKDILQRNGPAMTVAAGLAMRSI